MVPRPDRSRDDRPAASTRTGWASEDGVRSGPLGLGRAVRVAAPLAAVGMLWFALRAGAQEPEDPEPAADPAGAPAAEPAPAPVVAAPAGPDIKASLEPIGKSWLFTRADS